METEKIVGKWACSELFDIQLSIFSSQECYLSVYDWEKKHRAMCNVLTQSMETEDGIQLCADDIEIFLKPDYNKAGGRVLQGTIFRGGASNEVKLFDTHEEPEKEPSFSWDPQNLVIPKEEFPKGNWNGAYSAILSNDSLKCEMNLEETEKGYSILLCFSGYGAWSPIGCAVVNGELVWLINDASNRGICRLKFSGKELIGTYAQVQCGTEQIVFHKESDTVKDFEAMYRVKPSKLSREEILRRYADYDRGQSPVKIEFVLGEKLPECLDRYDLGKYTEGKEGDELVFALLDFICDNFHHDGCSGMPSWPDHRKLQDFVLYYEKMGRTNCRGLSIMLSALLRSFGIRAQHVTCLPYEDPCSDCHVVVDCHMPSGGRLMLDPTYRLWFKDQNGEYVSIQKLRRILIDGAPLVPNQEARYNSGKQDEEFSLDDYRNYMSKNTLRFSKGQIAKDGDDDKEPMWLLPKNYDYTVIPHVVHETPLTDEKAFWGE